MRIVHSASCSGIVSTDDAEPAAVPSVRENKATCSPFDALLHNAIPSVTPAARAVAWAASQQLFSGFAKLPECFGVNPRRPASGP